MSRLNFLAASLVLLGACAAAPQPGVHIRQTVSHDQQAFTQGLEMHQGRLYESQGLYGQSAIRELNPADGSVIKQVALPDSHFGEGLTIAGDEIVQLTWREGIAHRWSLDLEPKGTYTYEGEGWGLCFDGNQFYMSDGSSTLTVRDQHFSPVARIAVTRDGQPVDQLNELECANGQVYANVWHQDYIVRIDPASGTVTNVIEMKTHMPPGLGPEEVLNGIAQTEKGTWLMTGKQWPVMYEAKIIEPDLGQKDVGFRPWADPRY